MVVREILNYAKRRDKSQIVQKFAGSVILILCDSVPAHLNVAYGM